MAVPAATSKSPFEVVVQEYKSFGCDESAQANAYKIVWGFFGRDFDSTFESFEVMRQTSCKSVLVSFQSLLDEGVKEATLRGTPVPPSVQTAIKDLVLNVYKNLHRICYPDEPQGKLDATLEKVLKDLAELMPPGA